MTNNNITIGFIGLGAMGFQMARNLAENGIKTAGFDKNPERMNLLKGTKIVPGNGVENLIEECEVLMTSLPSSKIFVDVAKNSILKNGRKGQVLIDVGTVEPSECRKLAGMFAEKGMTLIDAPVTGGEGGAASGNLGIFLGGDKEAINKYMYVFEAIGDPGKIVYCGESGSGQIVKGVNQMAMGLGTAAYLESVFYGVSLGIDAKILMDAVGGDSGWRSVFKEIAKAVAVGEGYKMGVKHGQLQYFISEAQNEGHDLPISQALYEYLKNSECTIKEANRMSPSFWNELEK